MKSSTRETMPIARPLAAWILPLLVAAAAFKWWPESSLLGPAAIGSFLAGWIGLGFCAFRRPWLKVTSLICYPVLMVLAVTLVMVFVYGVPGLH
jgi:hypothetical protein